MLGAEVQLHSFLTSASNLLPDWFNPEKERGCPMNRKFRGLGGFWEEKNSCPWRDSSTGLTILQPSCPGWKITFTNKCKQENELISGCSTLTIHKTRESSELTFKDLKFWTHNLFTNFLPFSQQIANIKLRTAQLVEALRYKLDGRGFDSRWCHWNFSLT
jgi:hypothetical protein